MSAKIDTVSARGRLTAQREPYWHRLSKGCFVGYRKMSSDAAGIWRARFRDQNGRQQSTTLGSLEEFPPHERFDRAASAAREWITLAGAGLRATALTVFDACYEYAEFVRERKGDAAAKELTGRYDRWVAGDPIADLPLPKLTRADVDSLRRRMVAAPVQKRPREAPRERSKDTVNRDMAAVRAALNHALDNQDVGSDFAWRQPLKAFPNTARRRTLYLDYAQRKALVNNAPDDLASFIRGLAMIPLRPGALASLTCGDFDHRLNVLSIGKDKAGQDRKIMVPDAIAQLFSKRSVVADPSAPLLARADGLAWGKDSWKWPLKDAAKKAGLPEATTAYTLRHSIITDLVHSGLDLLTVAQISGTSVAMIEKHYGHLRGTIAAAALAKFVL